jgi:hypothetical protein
MTGVLGLPLPALLAAQIADSRRDALDRRFEAIRSRLVDVLGSYMAAREAGQAPTAVTGHGEVQVACYSTP